jgi:adenine phosphoribosyltransferase
MHADAVRKGGRYVIATGGTAAAVAGLVAQQGAIVATCLFLIELGFLNGRDKLPGVNVMSLITY